MPFGIVAAQNAALDAVVSSLPSPATWRVYSENPTEAPESELTGTGGVARVAYTGSEWEAAASGVKTATVDAGTSTGEWADVGYFWAICNVAGDVLLWDLMPEPIAVDEAGTAVEFSPALYFRNDF